jgi:hypothetical protein
MKKSIVFYAMVILTVLMMVLSSGCDTITSIFGKDSDDAKTTATGESNGKNQNGELVELAKSDRAKIGKIIEEFYKKLYKEPVEGYNKAGIIPEAVKEFIANRTKTEGNNNPEVGIHLPRYVEVNGMTVVGMETLDNGSKGCVESTYIGKTSDTYLFYTKVYLKAKCIPDDIFNANFKQNAQTGIYEKSPTAAWDANQEDYIRVISKYDVEVIKEDGSYKIIRAKEASTRQGFQKRLMLLNNEYIERLPYINIDKAADKKSYLNKDDGKQYDKEKAVIETFFNNLKEVDNERMNLLYIKWRTGQNEFTSFVKDVLKINLDKDKKEIIDITADYADKFSYDSFPLQKNMSKLISCDGFSITPHPGYTQKKKKYIVSFNAKVEKAIGVIGQQSTYNYDYFVTLSGEGDSVKVSGIYLNNCTYQEQ